MITVGVAYGSDTDRVRELLDQAAAGHPDVLEDPPHIAVFDGFGDNSLDFRLLAFISNVEKRFLVKHDLHTVIDKAFRKEGIEISFPQRDLHLRSVPDEWLRHLNAGGNQDRNEASPVS